MDFTPGEDLIDLVAFGEIASFADLMVTSDRHASCTDYGRVWCVDLTAHGGGIIKAPYLDLYDDELVASDFLLR